MSFLLLTELDFFYSFVWLYPDVIRVTEVYWPIVESLELPLERPG